MNGMRGGNHRVRCWHEDSKASEFKSCYKEIKDDHSLRLCLLSLLELEFFNRKRDIRFELEWNC